MLDPLDYIEQININTRGYQPVSHVIENAPFTGEKTIRLCRCWQSRKFPYCDDTHKLLIQAGDSVGPFIGVIRGYQPNSPPALQLQNRPVEVVARYVSHNKNVALTVCLCGAVGYLVADICHRWNQQQFTIPFLSNIYDLQYKIKQ